MPQGSEADEFTKLHCRIEDNVVITRTGCKNLTSVVKNPDELEKLISSN